MGVPITGLMVVILKTAIILKIVEVLKYHLADIYLMTFHCTRSSLRCILPGHRKPSFAIFVHHPMGRKRFYIPARWGAGWSLCSISIRKHDWDGVRTPKPTHAEREGEGEMQKED